MKLRTFCRLAPVVVVLAGTVTQVAASELVYRPVNPGFGGFSANYNYLIGLADIQNQHADGGGGGDTVFPEIDFPDIDIDLGGTPAAPAAPDAAAPAATDFTVNN